MELKNTQADLLKTLKNLYDLKTPPKIEITGPFKELVNDLESIKSHLDLLKPNKYLTSDKESYFYNLPKIHQYLNDVSGANMNFKYDNNYKMNPLIKFNTDSLNNIDSLLQNLKFLPFTERKEPVNLNWNNLNPDISNTDFTQKKEPVNLNWGNLFPDKSNTNFTEKKEPINLNWGNLNPDKSNTDFIAKNEKINLNWNSLVPDKSKTDFTQKNEKIFIDLKKTFTPDKTHLDFSVKKIDEPDTKEIEKNILVIREELKELTKLLAKIKLSRLTLTNYTSDKYLNDIKNNVDKYIVIDASDYPEKVKITNLSGNSYYKETDKLNYHNFTLHNDENDFTQLGGFANVYINRSTEYFNLLSEKDHLLKELKVNIDKNNLDYIHYYYFQLFILKTMNKITEIYQFITKPTLLQYCEKLHKLNEIISNPEKYILKSNVYANLYFKYFIIIKIVWVFLNAIKNKWTSSENDKISVFNNTNNEIAKYFLLFNLFYPILNRLKI